MSIEHLLPRQLTPLIGRTREIGEITTLLHKVPLVTLTGTGGVGKTRLAMEVCHSLISAQGSRFADGIWFVELDSVAADGLVPQTVATALRLVELDQAPVTDTLIRFLREKQALILLDNCEHVIGACAELAEQLLRQCAALRIIATSREPLRIAGENVRSVPPLPEPEAVALFATRAAEITSDCQTTLSDMTNVAQLCSELDGLPLAIELAAACVRSLTVEEIRARLSQRFDVLVGGMRTAPARQQSLRAMVDWSVTSLSPQERSLFAQLSVFAGGWTLESAEGICRAERDVFGVLQELVHKSLVVAEPRGGRMRYRLLETLRQYAADRLRELGQQAELRTSHLEWFASYAEQVEPELSGAEQLEWDDRIETEHANVRTALAWAQQTGEFDPGIRLAAALRLWWGRRGHLVEACDWLESLLSSAGDQLDVQIRARGHNALAYLRVRQGHPETGRHYAETALGLALQTGNEREEAEALLSLAHAHREQGDWTGTERRLRRVLDVSNDLLDDRLATNALIQVGWMLDSRGLPGDALETYAQALERIRRVSDPRLEAFALHRAASAALELGHLDLARQQLAAALSLRPSVTLVGRALAQSAGLAAIEGKLDRACRLAGAAIGVLENAGGGLHETERAQMDKRLAAARHQLGTASATAALMQGKSMRTDAAVAYALEDLLTVQMPTPRPSRQVLSQREMQVAQLIRDGLTNAQIADRLIISEGTAKRHVENMMAKLQVHSRAQIVDWLTRHSALIG